MRDLASYRPELDGLRAVAVMAVVLYHLDLAWVSGGFTGVDVFFVLSGYLITGLVSSDVQNGAFQFREFFLKRVRRLMPALLFMTTVVLAVACAVLFPVPLDATARSVMVQPFALQNVFFLLDGEYFSDSKTKLLLHTWSLGIEEQFYLVWPFLLFGLLRLRFAVQATVLATLIVISFALNISVLQFSPKMSFFLLPTRAWELGLGGLLALLELRAGGRLPRLPGAMCFSVGLVTLLGSFSAIRGGLTFPGWWALVPALGTLLMLSGVSSSTNWAQRALASAPVVFLGRLSYSLYLWHWPVIAFARRAGAEISAPHVSLLLFVVSLGLAYTSFRLVEEPIRRRKILTSDGALLRAVGIWALSLVVFSAGIIGTQGLALRYSGVARTLLTASFHPIGESRCGVWYRLVHRDEAICPIGRAPVQPPSRKLLLWGNSHAAMWMHLFQSLSSEHHAQSFLSVRNCRATVDSQFCNQEYQQAVLAGITSHGITDVVLANSWHGSYDIPDEEFEAQLISVVEKLAELPVRVWLVVDVPKGEGLDPEVQYQLDPVNPQFGMVSWEEFVYQRDLALRLFGELTARFDNVRVIDPSPVYCQPETGCPAGADGVSWFLDASHLTAAGTERARESFRTLFVD
jgi:peptidoglycan/LPS O-acetylase OafA/YrhL